MVEKLVARERMRRGISSWLTVLDSYPGWREWQRHKISYTLDYDDYPITQHDGMPVEFKFDAKITVEHAVVVQFLGLEGCLGSLKDCEFYFRRYPFRGTPVTRHEHLRNVCEMYFGRFYQFRERLKNFFKAVRAASPEYDLAVGKLIKQFDKEFDQELRERHGIHHREPFDEVAISKVFLVEIASRSDRARADLRANAATYRAVANTWAKRVRRRSSRMEAYLEAVAGVTLEVCPFLVEDRQQKAPENL